MGQPYCVVLVTVPNREAAEKVANAVLEARLAACVNQIPRVRSAYWWKGKIERAMECLLLLKTRTTLLPELMQCVRENHPYAVPEILSLPVAEGNKAYLEWLGASTPFPNQPDRVPRAT